MEKNTHPSEKRRGILFLGLVVLILFIFLIIGWFFIRQAESYAIESKKHNFLSRVRILSAAIDINHVKALAGRLEDITKPEYIHLKDSLRRVVKVDKRLRFAYLMGRQGGKVVFLVDNEPEDSADYSPPGQIY